MSSQQDTVLEVQGMTCPSCIRHVAEALKHDAAEAPVGRLIVALRDAGYESRARSAA